MNPAKLDASKENELLFKMLDVKPWPPLDKNVSSYQEHPKNQNDMKNIVLPPAGKSRS